MKFCQKLQIKYSHTIKCFDENFLSRETSDWILLILHYVSAIWLLIIVNRIDLALLSNLSFSRNRFASPNALNSVQIPTQSKISNNWILLLNFPSQPNKPIWKHFLQPPCAASVFNKFLVIIFIITFCWLHFKSFCDEQASNFETDTTGQKYGNWAYHFSASYFRLRITNFLITHQYDGANNFSFFVV